ncbi:MAG: pyridoxamine 5'-phosphate oxidase family protein [Myxococcales bacterium]|nr:pyridoxamine 5'-phosphate oxidase family protein [Myxococcales bacterium]
MATARAKLLDVLREFETVMFFTRTAEGNVRGRPMAIADIDPDGTLYLITSIDSDKAAELIADARVGLGMQSKTEIRLALGHRHPEYRAFAHRQALERALANLVSGGKELARDLDHRGPPGRGRILGPGRHQGDQAGHPGGQGLRHAANARGRHLGQRANPALRWLTSSPASLPRTARTRAALRAGPRPRSR